MMEKEFIPYEQALALKELGFDKPCLGYYIDVEVANPFLVTTKISDTQGGYFTFAPLYQQAARYLYIKSNNKINIQLNGSDDIEELNRKIKQGIQDLRNL